MVSLSEKPDSQLKVSEVSHVGGEKSKQYAFNIIAEGKEEYSGTEGFRAISENPLSNHYICTGGVISTSSEDQEDGVAPISVQEQGILIWKLDQSLLSDSGTKAKQGLPSKRLKTRPSNISPSGKIHCSGGLSALKWTGPNRIVAGCFDHSLKLINAERQ